jgi:hypothetical protein
VQLHVGGSHWFYEFTYEQLERLRLTKDIIIDLRILLKEQREHRNQMGYNLTAKGHALYTCGMAKYFQWTNVLKYVKKYSQFDSCYVQ